jgi:hypothetical protein
MGAASSASAAFTVIPRCSPLGLVRLWCVKADVMLYELARL